MNCFRCSKSIKGTGAVYVPQYRIMSMNEHLKQNCKRNKSSLRGLSQLIKVRELAGYDNTKILNTIAKSFNVDIESMKNELLDKIKEIKKK